MQRVAHNSTKVAQSAHPAHWFATTHWSMVLSACHGPRPQATQALEELCRVYWYPLFAFLRHSGFAPAEAQDLTQSFFAHLLEKDRLQTVTPAKGKFRSFLIASLKNFLANEHDRRQALKRGAKFAFVSLDAESGEASYRVEPFHELTPDKVFEQSWALALLDQVFRRLRADQGEGEKARVFEALQIYLSGDKGGVPYADTAARLNLTEGAVKMAVLRLRRRFGELLRAEIAHTVSTPEAIDEEIRCLFAAVSS